jgi:pimeloyl-ACP methyl ester carboxylesterase
MEIIMSWREIISDNLPQSTWLEVHGCSVHAHRWYHDGAVTLVLIHGAIANNVWWQHIAAQIKHGQVLSIDLSGHGLSAWDEPYNLSKHASEVEAYIQQYAKGEVVIIGHSYGGAVGALVASRLAAKHCVMLDTPLSIATDHRESSNKTYRKNVYATLEEAVSRFRPVPAQPIEEKELFEYIAEHSIQETDGGYVWQFDPSFHKRDISDEEQRQIKPILDQVQYWYGELSPFAAEPLLARAKNLGMHLEKIPNAYHAVMVDNPSYLLHKIETLL